ncbi:MAG: TlpA disulfide reductase family protein [Candidatus Eisenbacteria bacterium]
MTLESPRRLIPLLSVPLALGGSLTYAQSPATAIAPVTPPAVVAPAVPAAPPSPVSAIRNKLSAGDLLSAESVLEVHREKTGEDGAWLAGLGWLARGAMLLGDLDKAGRYAAQAHAACTARIEKGAKLDEDHDIEGALGAAIEVEAQRLDRTRGHAAAVAYVQHELGALPKGSDGAPGTRPLRSRLHKRIALLTFVGKPAPELRPDEPGSGPSLASLRGQPVVLFLWADWCGDCKAQAGSLARVLARHRAAGLQCVAVTRHYESGDSARGAETARADSVWAAVYASADGLGGVPRVLSEASMIEYGASATPTFVFIDRKGIVRRYTPTRLSETELEQAVAAILP